MAPLSKHRCMYANTLSSKNKRKSAPRSSSIVAVCLNDARTVAPYSFQKNCRRKSQLWRLSRPLDRWEVCIRQGNKTLQELQTLRDLIKFCPMASSIMLLTSRASHTCSSTFSVVMHPFSLTAAASLHSFRSLVNPSVSVAPHARAQSRPSEDFPGTPACAPTRAGRANSCSNAADEAGPYIMMAVRAGSAP